MVAAALDPFYKISNLPSIDHPKPASIEYPSTQAVTCLHEPNLQERTKRKVSELRAPSEWITHNKQADYAQ